MESRIQFIRLFGFALTLGVTPGLIGACSSPDSGTGVQVQGTPVADVLEYHIETNGENAPDVLELMQGSDGAVFLDGDIREVSLSEGPTDRDQLVFSGSPPSDNRTARSSSVYGNAHPYMLVGLVETNWGSCTGFLVGPRVVMTNGHCLGSAASGWASNVRFTPRSDPPRYSTSNSTAGPVGTFPAKAGGLSVPTAWYNCQSELQCQPHDKGWIVLQKSPNVGHFGVVSLASSTPYGSLKTLGYPGDKNPRVQYYASTTDWKNPPDAQKAARWFHNDWANIFSGLDVAGGQSGSPVWSNYAPYQNWWITALVSASGGYPGSDPSNKWPALMVRIDPGDIQVIGNLRAQNP